MKTCWSCNKHVPEGSTSCPHCSAYLSQGAIAQMATVGPGAAPSLQIIPGVLVNDRYEIVREIGRGGMGIVYLAIDTMMEKSVALKVIPQELCMDPRAVADLKRETGIAIELTHENIVRLYNLDTWEGQAFVVMEYVGGGTLAHIQAEGKLSLDEALPYLQQIALALDYSHSASPAVIHRDLKPLNILLGEDGVVKVADFGLARVMRDSATRVSGHDSAGTLAYMAPEQIRGKGIGKGTDIYAFAAIIYEMLSGNPPFYTGDLRWQILHEEVEAIEEQPDYVNAALHAGLAKDRDDRPDTASELLAYLTGDKELSKRPAKKKRKAKVVKQKVKSEGSSFGKIIVTFLTLFALTGIGAGGYYYSSDVKELVRGGPILTVDSEPSGATLYVDEGKVETTPASVASLPNGTHTILLKKDNYTDYTEKIFIQQNRSVHLNAQMEPAPFGDISISSNPFGATVLVDDTEKGITPLILSQIDKGKRQLKLQKDGFDIWERKVDVVPLQTADVSAKLISSYGQLQVTSVPSGASVTVEGKDVGKTPLQLEKLSKGQHSLDVQLDRFDRFSKKITIKSETKTELHADLVSSYGTLSVTSEPEGATVLFRGKKIGTTPLTTLEVPKGKGKLEIQKKGYLSYTKNMVVKLSGDNVLHSKLEPGLGKVKVTSVPSGATIKIAGEEIGKTPLEFEYGLGNIELQISKVFYKPQKKKVEVVVSDIKNVALSLKQVQHIKDATTEMEFVLVPGGCFQMGDTFDIGNKDEKPVHKVCLDDFYIGKHEVTQKEYKRITGNNPSQFKKGARYPVENVSWEDAQAFIRKLNKHSALKYRLPTEAEWEYGARSQGKREKYSGDRNVNLVAWYKNNSSNSTHPVGTKKANGLGIFDMSGNVWEWVSDWYSDDYYKNSPQLNPRGPAGGSLKVRRGGSWLYFSSGVRGANRDRYEPWNRNAGMGFRLALSFSK